MTINDWCTAVGREMHADRWYQDAEQGEEVQFSLTSAMEAIAANKNGNDHCPKVSVSAV